MLGMKNSKRLHPFRSFVFFIFSIAFLGGCAIKAKKEPSTLANLKVLSYNIHHANPPSKPNLIDIDAIVGVIKSADVDLIGLQEVDNGTARSGHKNQAKLIADKLGYQYRYFKAIDHDGGEYGLAILSRLSIDTSILVQLPQKVVAEKRILAAVQLTVGGQPVIFATTHLDATRDPINRQVQIEHIVDYFKSEKKAVILCGDLNAVPDSKVIQTLDNAFRRSCVEGCEHTVPQIQPRRTIDYIAVKNANWTVVSHHVLAESYASDHRPVKVIFGF